MKPDSSLIYREVMNCLTVAVFVLGPGRSLLFANNAGESLLLEGDKISVVAGQIHAAGPSSEFHDAVDRALRGELAFETSGFGVPLTGHQGERAAAFILPLAASHGPSDFGRGSCVVFVNSQVIQPGLAISVLRGLFDFTMAEARIALMIARGNGPLQISNLLNIKVNTVRTHLKHIYAKADVEDQTGLAACVNALLPPIH